jgi:hypothetical protein
MENYSNISLQFSSGARMELDVFIPELKLALEYQGQQYFLEEEKFSKRLYIERAHQKREGLLDDFFDQFCVVCSRQGITLVEIPYWWDMKVESLQAIIHEAKKNIFQTLGI